MKTRCISGVAVALALSAAVTLFAQAPAPSTGGQPPSSGSQPPAGSPQPPAGSAQGAGAAQSPGGLSPAQQRLLPKAVNAPDIPFKVVPNFMKLPPNVYMGEGIGIATNSKGHIFVNTCAQQTRNFEFDQNGNYLREIGKDSYGHVFCHGLRVDAQDNIWVIDEGANSILKYNPEGRVTMVLGRRGGFPYNGMEPPAKEQNPAPPYTFNRPTDVGFDSAGNIFVADGYGNSRIVKYDKNGRFLKQVGSRGPGPGQFNLIHAIAVDAQGNVYAGSRSDQRIEVFDNELNYKTTYDHVGAPWSLCITPGPHQYLYTSNSNPDNQDTQLHKVSGQIFKMELDGTVIGKFGVPGKEQGQFSTVHGIDCRVDNEILVSEIVEWRFQKFILQPTKPTTAEGGKK
jgi:sugar lactone lactonase YvrE